MKTRVYTLDYLRGIAALLILIYHYLSFGGEGFNANSFIQRVGYYGVTIFYILSGLTLFYVYNAKLKLTVVSLKSFFIKRAARILPLLSIVTFITIVLSRKIPNIIDAFLNFSGLFGFFKWDVYFATGAWSIGNEMVFYAFFPFLLFFSIHKSTLFWFLGLCIFIMSTYFSFHVLPVLEQDQATFWSNYINPLNQLIYFYSGIAIGKMFVSKRNSSSKWPIFSFILALIIFIYYPTGADHQVLVIETNRYLFFSCCIIMVTSLFVLKDNSSTFFHKPLLFFGEISYGVYLFHPVVYSIFRGLITKLHISCPSYLVLILSALISILVSYISYEYFEKKCINMASNYLKR